MSQNEPYVCAKDSAFCRMLCDMMGDVELCLRANSCTFGCERVFISSANLLSLMLRIRDGV